MLWEAVLPLAALSPSPQPPARSHAIATWTATWEQEEWKKTQPGTKPNTWADGQTATGGRHRLPAQISCKLASPHGWGGLAALRACEHVSQAVAQLPAHLEGVLRQEEGLQWVSPPPPAPSALFTAGMSTGHRMLPRALLAGMWERGGEKKGGEGIYIYIYIHFFTSWAQNNNKITGMFEKEGAGLGKG